jgi:hypothetical protein
VGATTRNLRRGADGRMASIQPERCRLLETPHHRGREVSDKRQRPARAGRPTHRRRLELVNETIPGGHRGCDRAKVRGRQGVRRQPTTQRRRVSPQRLPLSEHEPQTQWNFGQGLSIRWSLWNRLYDAMRLRHSASRTSLACPPPDRRQIGARRRRAFGFEVAKRSLLGFQRLSAMKGPHLRGWDLALVKNVASTTGTRMW